jgi:dinuclear metal center YbgI/SA1388 family protein
MPLTVREIASVLESWAPPSLAESYDNVGLIVGNPDAELRAALVNLDVTEAVVEEAEALGAGLIITHHPIWFSARKRLTPEDYTGRVLLRAIRKDIALYALHTNLDAVRSGVNGEICRRLGLEETAFLRASGPESGSGMIGSLPSPLPAAEFLARVKQAFRCQSIRYAEGPQSRVSRVAVCGGAGSFLIGDALRADADAFVTADISYHKFFEAESRMYLLDIGHHESEQFTSDEIVRHLREKFPTFALHLSQTNTNPLRYFS